MDLSLDELIARFRHGDETAARELYDRFIDRMLALVRQLLAGTPHRGALDSEDIVHSGFLSFFSAVQKPQFDARKGQIGGLLATIVRRKALVKLRRKYPTSYAPDDLGTIQETTTVLLDGVVSEQEAETALRQKIVPILDELTERERRVLALHLDQTEKRSLEEIAKSCRMALGTVENTIDAVIARLKEQLAADDEPGGR